MASKYLGSVSQAARNSRTTIALFGLIMELLRLLLELLKASFRICIYRILGDFALRTQPYQLRAQW
jgi:hypothetical protein